LLVGLAFGRGGVYPLVTAEDSIHVGAEIGVVLLLLVLGPISAARCFDSMDTLLLPRRRRHGWVGLAPG